MKLRGLIGLSTLLAFVALSSCKKEEKKSGDVTISVAHRMDGVQAVMDTLAFQHPAGYPYSVTRLQYYLSGFRFKKSDGSMHSSAEVLYFDMDRPEFSSGKLFNIPAGEYESVTFYLGLDSNQNKTAALPATTENVNMAWPDPMGGGYHFMKFEGYYKNNKGTYGYAMHLGRNANLVTITLPLSQFEVNGNRDMKLIMNLQEWFKNPALYDFDVDGNYSMGSMPAMQKLKTNGSDIFTFSN